MRISDWSSDVCSSDLSREISPANWLLTIAPARWVPNPLSPGAPAHGGPPCSHQTSSNFSPAIDQLIATRDRKSVGSGKRVSVRVDLGGRRIITNKTLILSTHSNTPPSFTYYKY